MSRRPRNRCFIVQSYFNTLLHVVVGDVEWSRKRLAGLGFDASSVNDGLSGMFIASENGLVLWLETRSVSVLVHELIHASTFVLSKQLGTPLDFDSSETQAYFLQDMMEKIMARWQ